MRQYSALTQSARVRSPLAHSFDIYEYRRLVYGRAPSLHRWKAVQQHYGLPERRTTSQASRQDEVWGICWRDYENTFQQVVWNWWNQSINYAKEPIYHNTVLYRHPRRLCPEFWFRVYLDKEQICDELHLFRGRWVNLAIRVPYACHACEFLQTRSRNARFQSAHRAGQMRVHEE